MKENFGSSLSNARKACGEQAQSSSVFKNILDEKLILGPGLLYVIAVTSENLFSIPSISKSLILKRITGF